MLNTAGDPVLVVPIGNNQFGRRMYDIEATFKPAAEGNADVMSLSKFGVTLLDLNCTVSPDPQTEVQVGLIRSSLNTSFAETVGYVVDDAALHTVDACHEGECALGDMVADAALALTQSDVALINSGTFGEPLLASMANSANATATPRPVVRGQVARALPQMEEVVQIPGVTGRQIRDALASSLERALARPDNKAGDTTPEFLQVGSTLEVNWWQTGGQVANRTKGAAGSTAGKVSIASIRVRRSTRTVTATAKTTGAQAAAASDEHNTTNISRPGTTAAAPGGPWEWVPLDLDGVYSVATTSRVARGAAGTPLRPPT